MAEVYKVSKDGKVLGDYIVVSHNDDPILNISIRDSANLYSGKDVYSFYEKQAFDIHTDLIPYLYSIAEIGRINETDFQIFLSRINMNEENKIVDHKEMAKFFLPRWNAKYIIPIFNGQRVRLKTVVDEDKFNLIMNYQKLNNLNMRALVRIDKNAYGYQLDIEDMIGIEYDTEDTLFNEYDLEYAFFLKDYNEFGSILNKYFNKGNNKDPYLLSRADINKLKRRYTKDYLEDEIEELNSLFTDMSLKKE